MNETDGTRQRNNTIFGWLLIGLGLVFLFDQATGIALSRWWAFFLLLPGLTALGQAWAMWNQDGQRLTPRVAGTAIGGLVPTAIGLIFLLNLSWALMWPVFLVIAGLSMIAGPRARRHRHDRGNWEAR